VGCALVAPTARIALGQGGVRMTDNITLPRVAAEKLGKLVALPENIDKFWKDNDYAALAALAALATALAEPEPESDAQCPTCGGGGLVPDPTWDWVRCDVCNPLPEKPEPTVKDSLTVDATREPVAHVENGVLVRSALPKGYTGPLYAAPPEPDAKREPATEKQVAEVFKLSGAVYWGHYRNGWREAERFHGIRKEDGK